MGSCLSQGHKYKEKREELCLVLKFESLIPFPTTITVTLSEALKCLQNLGFPGSYPRKY